MRVKEGKVKEVKDKFFTQQSSHEYVDYVMEKIR
jgi:hypothetical protein